MKYNLETKMFEFGNTYTQSGMLWFFGLLEPKFAVISIIYTYLISKPAKENKWINDKKKLKDGVSFLVVERIFFGGGQKKCADFQMISWLY